MQSFENLSPYIKEIEDLDDPKKCCASHPFVLGTSTRADILEWRKQRQQEVRMIEEFTDVEKDEMIKSLDFKLPPNYYLENMKIKRLEFGTF